VQQSHEYEIVDAEAALKRKVYGERSAVCGLNEVTSENVRRDEETRPRCEKIRPIVTFIEIQPLFL